MSETQLQRSIQQRLELMPGVKCWRCNTGAGGKRRSVKYGLRDLNGEVAGTQDLLCCAAGLWVALECKLPGEELDPAQLKRQQETREAGGISEVVCSVDQAVAVVEAAIGQRSLLSAAADAAIALWESNWGDMVEGLRRGLQETDLPD
jgi:hypothetical protein